jgi:cytochrome c biogenesis protein
MKLFKVQKVGNLFLDLKFAIFLLGIIAFASSFGSVIEQDEVNSFYEENYSVPIYGVFDSKFILFLGLDHVYRTWWFLSLLCLLAISLIACTLTRQFPIVTNSKKSFFKKESKSYSVFPFLAKMKNFFF